MASDILLTYNRSDNENLFVCCTNYNKEWAEQARFLFFIFLFGPVLISHSISHHLPDLPSTTQSLMSINDLATLLQHMIRIICSNELYDRQNKMGQFLVKELCPCI